MKAFGKKLSKFVNLVGDSVDLNTLKDKQTKLEKKYKQNIDKLNKQLSDLENNKKEIDHLYDFKEKYQNLNKNNNNIIEQLNDNLENDSDEEEMKVEIKQESIHERINLVFTEMITKLTIIEMDVDSKIMEVNTQKEEFEREYLRTKEEINQQLRNVRDKINKKKDALF